MSIATRSPSKNGSGPKWRSHASAPRFGATRGSSDRPAVRRNTKLPVAAFGIVLVVAGAIAFALVSLRTAGGEEVLAVTRSLPAGRVLTPGDLSTVRLSGASTLSPVPVTDEQSVVGRPVAVPIVSGTLLSTGELGATSPLSSGSEEVALALRAGQYPPDLFPGARVDVVPVSSADGAASSPTALPTSPVAATVSALAPAPPGSNASTIVSLVVSARSANGVAALAANGAASLVELPNGPTTGTSQGS